MGENGCGKSTLIKIISGAQPADAGELLIDGKPVGHLTPVAALAAGVETVYQDFLSAAQPGPSPKMSA